MAHNYILSPQAKSDLYSIRQYIARENPIAAKNLIEDIFKSMNNLADNPAIGHKRDDLTVKPVRFLSVKHFMIVYQIDSPVRIVRILSGYRDVSSLL